jgi:hypothetical protein
MAIRRFRGRSCDVKAFYSYMGTNLRGAEAKLKKDEKDEKMKKDQRSKKKEKR